MTNTDLNNLHKTHKEQSLFGRYIHLKKLFPLLQNLPLDFKVETIGKSVLDQDIFSVTIGNGSKKILMWSQMHGNESTTTKAIFDLFNTFKSGALNDILRICTIKIIPMLNPDGAKLYTRLNAVKVDLNRDAQDLSQPESQVLRHCFNNFKPDFCFNLHGQRTIFSAGQTNNTATLSFLAPAEDEARTVTNTRKKAMEIIAAVNTVLQQQLPNQIGRYDDGFNANCVGDTFQMSKTPTILYEAGHYLNDYNREEVRRYVYQALIVALNYITKNEVTGLAYQTYFDIPENGKLFYDIIIKNAKIKDQILDVAIQFEERLVDETLNFIPKIEKIENLKGFYAHKWIDANKLEVKTPTQEDLFIGFENDFVLINNVKKSLKP